MFIYIVIFTTVHWRRSANSTSCWRSRPLDPTLRGRTPTYQHIPSTATHDRAHSNATMRKHAPQALSHITKAATAVPAILLRGPPEAQNTIAWQRAPNERPFRTQCKGDPQLQPARNGRGGVFGPAKPENTASGRSCDQHPPYRCSSQRPRPQSRRSPKSSSTGRTCEH
jgi:hypothetical protein